MKVLNKGLKVILLGTTLMTSVKASADLTQSVTEYTSLANAVKIGVPESDKALEIVGVSGSDLDKGYLGTIAASSDFYILLDNASKLKALAIIGNKWCTFESGVLGTTSSSGQIHLTQTKEDGVNNTTKKLTINLTKTTGANLSAATVGTWLRSALTAANKSFSAGSLKTLSAPATGWTATALFQLAAGSNGAGDALAGALDPIAFTLTAPVTPAAGGSAVNFTANLTDISAYNVAVNDAYSASVALTRNSDTLAVALKPGKIASHATSIMTGIVADANDLSQRRLKTSAPYTYALPADSASEVLASIGASSPLAIAEDLAAQHARLATDPTDASTDTLKEAVDVILGKLAADATNVETSVVAQLARLATDPSAGSTDTVKEAIDMILSKLAADATNVQTSVVAQLARLATDPSAGSTDTVKEAIDVILAKIGSGVTVAETGIVAQLARLATDPAAGATDTVKEAIDVILAKIGSGVTVAETGLNEVVSAIGASSSVSIKADLSAQHQRLVTDHEDNTTNTLKKGIDVILAQISATAENVQSGLAEIVALLGGSNLKEGLKVVAKGYVDSDNFTASDCSVAVDTNKYGAVSFTSHDITNMTDWHAAGASVVVEGEVNGNARTFTCNVTGLNKFLDDTESGTQKKVLEFTSIEGDVFWIKAFDATGLDASGFATAGYRDDYLALLIADKFSTVTGIDTKTLLQLRNAAAS